MPLRSDRITKQLLEGADRPVPDWIRKKQSAKNMLGQESGASNGSGETRAGSKSKGTDLEERNILDSHNTRKKFKSHEATKRDAERAARRERNKRADMVTDYPYQLRALPVSNKSAVAQFAMSRGSHKRWMEDDLEEDIVAPSGVLAEVDVEPVRI